MKQHKDNKTNILMRSQKNRRKKRRRGGSSTNDEDDDEEDDVKVEDWEGRYFTTGFLI